MKKIIIGLVLSALFISGCGELRVSYFTTTKFPPREKNCELKDFAYDESKMQMIATLNADKSNEAESMKLLNETACQLGADGFTAFIKSPSTDPTRGDLISFVAIKLRE